jgi:hypothetical protein
MADKPFNIVEYIPELIVDQVSGGWGPTVATTYSSIFLSGSPDGFYYQSQIDLAGWTKEGLTAFFSNQYIQRDGPYSPGVAPVVASDVLQARDYIIVTDVPLQVTSTMIQAGFPSDASDYMTIKFAQCEIFVQSTTTPVMMIKADSFRMGSGQPTAAGTLYVTRICVPFKVTGAPTDSITFPGLRYIAQGIATAESELVHINRLRRSYELQQ